MSSFYTNTESITVLRRLAALHFCIGNFHATEDIALYLHSVKLGVSDRHLERILTLLTSSFGLERTTFESGRCHYSCDLPDDWFVRLDGRCEEEIDGSVPVGHDLSGMLVDIPEAERREEQDVAEKMMRIMVIVKLLPFDDDGIQGISSQQIRSTLARKGFKVSARTVQRDMRFVEKHFVVRACPGTGRQVLWKKMERGDWVTNFRPRFPRFVLEDRSAVARFLYGSHQAVASTPEVPDAWIRSVDRLRYGPPPGCGLLGDGYDQLDGQTS